MTNEEFMKLKNGDAVSKKIFPTGSVGKETFGYDRIFNRMFYTSGEWKAIRKKIIFRDNGNNLGSERKIVKGEVKGIDRAIGCIIMYHHLKNSDNRVETRGLF